LLTISTISRLLVFAVTCASLPKLRQMPAVSAARFVLPGRLIIPAAAMGMIAWLLASSSWIESRDVTILILLGTLVYAMARPRGKKASQTS
jgi:hypothetical protein